MALRESETNQPDTGITTFPAGNPIDDIVQMDDDGKTKIFKQPNQHNTIQEHGGQEGRVIDLPVPREGGAEPPNAAWASDLASDAFHFN